MFLLLLYFVVVRLVLVLRQPTNIVYTVLLLVPVLVLLLVLVLVSVKLGTHLIILMHQNLKRISCRISPFGGGELKDFVFGGGGE